MIIVWLDRKYCIFQTDTPALSSQSQRIKFSSIQTLFIRIFEAKIPPNLKIWTSVICISFLSGKKDSMFDIEAIETPVTLYDIVHWSSYDTVNF